MTCSHTMTRGRIGETGGWCISCGEKVYDVDQRECAGCKHAKQLLDGWICSKHLMRLPHDMRVTFKIAEGTCWDPIAQD